METKEIKDIGANTLQDTNFMYISESVFFRALQPLFFDFQMIITLALTLLFRTGIYLVHLMGNVVNTCSFLCIYLQHKHYIYVATALTVNM